ncbi:MAG: LamG domain-containing protein, partial [Candidatus Nanoarchaeia archaeon]|nr:LamG domain-containing protein [Candidatus Nanoarchaeia archaeon]
NYDYITVSNIVNDNQWHHITETYDGTTAKLYVDGIFAGDSNSANGDITYTGLNSFKIGKIDSSTLSISNWSGLIDEVKVWNRALTDSEILNEYQNGDFRAARICSFGENKIIENSYVQLKCLDLKKFISGNDLTISWSLILKNSSLPYDNYSVYPYVKDSANPEVFRDGGNISFVASPTTPINKAPSLLPLTPSSGESFPNQEVNFSYGCTDPDGIEDFIYCSLGFIDEISPSIPVFLSYYPNENRFILFNETNNSVIAGNCTPGANVIIENKNSKIDCSKINVLKPGLNVSLKFSIVFKENLAGKTYSVKYYAQDKAQPNHIVYEIKGSWTIKNIVLENYPPVAGSANPSSGEFFIDEESSFNFDYSDPNGFTDISSTYVIIDSNVSNTQKVLAIYYPSFRKIEIRDDLNNSRIDGNCTIGNNETISNYYTNISCLNSRVSSSGDSITVYLNFIFKDKFIGQRKIFIKVIDTNGTSSVLKEVGNISIKKRIPNNCTDSDGGKNYTTKGVTNGTSGALTDYCVNATTLKEYYCSSSGDASFISYRCPQNCSSGKCNEIRTMPIAPPSTPEPDESEVYIPSEPETTEPDSSQAQGKTAGEIALWVIIWTIIVIFFIVLIYLIYSLNKKRALRKKPLSKFSTPVVRHMPPGIYRPPFRR